MKRILCAFLCAIMMALFSTESLAAISYTLPEKMGKQLEIGSGLKGSFRIHADGNHSLMLALQPIQDAELQLRGIRAGEEIYYYLYQAGENEKQVGLTEYYANAESAWIRSDLLPGEVFSLPGFDKLADLVSAPAGGNPSLASALLRWLRLSEEDRKALLEPLTESLTHPLELWVARFATVSEVRTLENGTSAFDMIYDIPMSELKTELVTLYREMLAGESGRQLLDRLFTDEQKAVFANPNLDYYYLEALNVLKNDYDLLYTQTVSTLGDTISSTLELPLDEKTTRFSSLVIEEKDGLRTFTLQGEESVISLMMGTEIDWSEISGASVWIHIRPGTASEGESRTGYHALRADLKHESQLSTDEESRDHQTDVWTVTIEKDTSRIPQEEDAALYPEEEPIRAELSLHYSSKYNQSSPTTLAFRASVTAKDIDLTAEGQMKTASPWTLTPFATENAVELTGLNSEELNLKLAEFMASASEQFKPTPSGEPAAEESPEAAGEAGEESGKEPEKTAVTAEEPAEATEKPSEPETTTEPAESGTAETETKAAEAETADPEEEPAGSGTAEAETKSAESGTTETETEPAESEAAETKAEPAESGAAEEGDASQAP